jgi:hypothetical protein
MMINTLASSGGFLWSPDEAKRNEIFDKAKASSSWQAATPTVGTNEWFSRTLRMLK